MRVNYLGASLRNIKRNLNLDFGARVGAFDLDYRVNLVLLAVLLLTTTACLERKKEKNGLMDTTTKSNAITQHFYVGTYTDSASKGIYKYALLTDGSLQNLGLAAATENPSFLAFSADKKHLLCVNEIDENGAGKVTSYAIRADSLSLIDQRSSGGAHPCFISINNEGHILVANYTGGNVGLLKLNENGSLSELLDVRKHKGKGTTGRQKGPHAHSALFEPASENIIALDLGTNSLWFSKLNETKDGFIKVEPSQLHMTPGAGPRHLAFHPSKKWIYIFNELNSTISLVQKESEANYNLLASFSTLPETYDGENIGADIHISADGQFLYASNRGHNSIAIYKIHEDGKLEILNHQSTQGDWPRNFALSPDENFLLVANKRTNTIVSFKRDKTTGMLTYTSQIAAPDPVCILF